MSNATTTTTDNVTPIASTVALPIIVCAFLGGLACENAIRGIWLSICQIRENPDQNLSAKIILCCNIVIVIDVVIYQWSNASVESTCYVVSLLGEAFYHLFMVIFGGYLLFKTWMALNKRPVFFIFASVLLVNRIAWAAAESYLSYGSWNSDSEACEWHSNVTLMTGVYLSDILIDLLSTVTMLVESRKFKETEFQPLFHVLISENLVRSACSLCMATFGFIVTWKREAQLVQFIFYSVQTYFVGHLLNSEHYWFARRNAAIPDTYKGDNSMGV